MPLPRRRNCLPACVPSGMSMAALPASVGIVDLAAQRSGGDADRHLAVQVVAIALEDVVLLEADLDVQVARRPAVGAGLAVAGLRMRMPSSMPAGILTSSVFCRLILPWPWQVVQGSG